MTKNSARQTGMALSRIIDSGFHRHFLLADFLNGGGNLTRAMSLSEASTGRL